MRNKRERKLWQRRLRKQQLGQLPKRYSRKRSISAPKSA